MPIYCKEDVYSASNAVVTAGIFELRFISVIPTGKKNNGLEVYERIQPANESQSYFPYHFDVDVVAGSRQIRNNPKPNKLPKLNTLYEHTDTEATGLAFNGYSKLLLFFNINPPTRLFYRSLIIIILKIVIDIYTVRTRNKLNIHL